MNNTSEAPGGDQSEKTAVKDTRATTAASENTADTRAAQDDPGVWKGRYEELRQSYELGMPVINKELETLKIRTAELESALKGERHGGSDLRRPQTGSAAALEKLVSPAHSSTPAASGALDTEVFSEEQIRTFYNTLARGRYKGAVSDAREMEKRITRAVKEGRVTGR